MTEKTQLYTSTADSSLIFKVSFENENYRVSEENSGWIGLFNKDGAFLPSDRELPSDKADEVISELANGELLLNWLAWKDA
jgi:hypothetical protein